MKKKSILTAVVSIALVAVLAVGATLAYFTSKDSASNTFTMGNVKINLTESNDGTTFVEDGLTYTDVMPGDTATKIAKVTVDSNSSDCYVRVTAQVNPADGSTLTTADIAALTTAVQNAVGSDWTVTQANGLISCVYNQIATKDQQLVLFDTITIPSTLGNTAANQQFTIDLNAYAVQSDNVDFATLDWSTLSFD